MHSLRRPRRRPAVPWEFHRGRQKIQVAVSGRLTVNNARTLLGACAAGHGIGQVLALGTEDLRNSGKLIDLVDCEHFFDIVGDDIV